ncbi:Protein BRASSINOSTEROID INSENSITIVE 1 [Platanthera zijinensis]|uniref:Protein BRASSINOSTEROID INSENSITIVE 1 n=1 Tax=Platanthera zijinensis TaxID=2320716 RepID=A0AAP0G5H7_9ASPA
MAFPLLLLPLLSLLTTVSCSCNPPHRLLLSLAFSSVSNFLPPPPSPDGDCIRQIRLPSQNLSGAISWMFLRNITTLQTLDLSSNALEGSIPGGFWSTPALARVNLAGNNLGGSLRLDRSGLRVLNLSGNRFTAVTGFSRLAGLRVLDLSRNKLRGMPSDLKSLPHIEYLDVSDNSMAGKFPADFPAITGLKFLNVSCNNLTGEVDSDALAKFGSSAFAKGGVLNRASASSHRKSGEKHGKRKGAIAGAAAGAGILVVGLVIAGALFCARKRTPEKEMETGAAAEEVGWVKEARWGSAVVVFEKPLMELKFADLAAATSGFGKESLMAEGGRSGPVYRAVLPGDMHVVVRVMESARGLEEKEAAAAFREISRLRHRNVLPLFGYCVSGSIFFLFF